MSKLILGFTGEIASGKGEACDYIVKKYQAGYHRFSTIIRDLLDRLHLEQNRKNMQTMSSVLRRKFSQNIFAKVIAADVEHDRHKIICVDGIRRLADIEYLKKLPNFHLLHIYADEQVRYKRIIKRAENSDDKNKTFKQFQKDQQGEPEQAIKEVAKHADHRIDNKGTIKELHAEVDNMLIKLR